MYMCDGGENRRLPKMTFVSVKHGIDASDFARCENFTVKEKRTRQDLDLDRKTDNT